MYRCMLVAASVLIAAAAQAQSSPTGLWKTIDDKSKKEKSLVRITEQSGVLTGTIEELLDPQAKAGEICEACRDERRNRPMQGLPIIRNVTHSQDDPALWDGGDILDPKTGSIYRVRLKPVDDGSRLEVRGYVGSPTFGRTQIWVRVE